MKIGNPADRLPGATTATGTTSTTGNGQNKGAQRAGGEGSQGGSSATVKLSSPAYARLDGTDGGCDAAKVKRVQDAIADGTYKINPGAIADKLIANAQELLSKKSGV